MTQIDKDIYLGALDDALDLNKMAYLGVGAVINLSHAISLAPWDDQDIVQRIWVPIKDGATNPIRSYVLAVKMLHTARSVYGKVMIHCHKGQSRSPFVVALYLAATRGIAFRDALKLVESKHTRTQIHTCHMNIAERVLECLRCI